MLLLTTLISIDCRIIFTPIRFYALAIKHVSPIKRLSNIASEVANTCEYLRHGRREEYDLQKRMEDAESLVEYEKCTNALDEMQGHDEWKEEKDSIEREYDPTTIELHVEALQNAVVSNDLRALQLLIRTSLSRELGGMNILRLYKHSWFGTKKLVDEYINTAVTSIEEFVRIATKATTSDHEVLICRQALEDSLKYFGRSALTLSGGAIFGMKHVGVAKCLWESDLLPEIISGASAGSIVAAIIGSSNDEEMQYILDHFPESNLAVFDPQGTGHLGWVTRRLSRYIWSQSFFDDSYLEVVMKEWLKDITFKEAYNKTKRVLNICVSSADSSEPRLLNHITAPDVFIWSAVCASCAVPIVFAAASIYEKDPVSRKPVLWMQNAQQRFVDGSLDHDIPMRKLSELFNVNFLIVSQVNPHVRVFLAPEEAFKGKQPTRAQSRQSIIKSAQNTLRQRIVQGAQFGADLGFPAILWRWASLLNQQYTGDINILPAILYREYFSMMMNPTPSFMKRSTLVGERSTWPKMCRIKNCVAIELALIQGIRDLNERLHFSPEARAARESARSSSRGRTRRGSSARPEFLRQRSLSSELRRRRRSSCGSSGLLPAGNLHMRRNVSLGNIDFRPSITSISAKAPPYLSPQAGLDNDLEGLMMTAPDRADS